MTHSDPTPTPRRPSLRPAPDLNRPGYAYPDHSARRTTRVASTNAAAYWTSLRTDMYDVVTELLALDVRPAVSAAALPAQREPLPAAECSDEIDTMRGALPILRAQLREARRSAIQRDRSTALDDREGLQADRLYERDGEVYRTVLSGAGRLYAKIWTSDGWEYDSRAIRSLRPEHRMTVERAKELSVQFGRCIRCGALLTADESVERGIGPVCITKI